MTKAVGIDLGTTNSVVAVMEGGKPTVIPNAEGGRTTPSVIAFSKSGERLVGLMARRQAVVNPWNTAYSVKRFMGRQYDEVESERKLVSYKVTKGSEGRCRIPLNDKEYTPEELSAMIIQKLKRDAEQYLGDTVSEAVITVPAYFNDAQRQATKDAGKIAGLKVQRIINEPTAAALAYGLDKDKEEIILVFDLGGGTFDVSILEVGDGVFEVKATAGDTHLGGDDFDSAILNWLADEFQRLEGVDLRKDPQALQRLTESAEKAKIELSSVTETDISLPFVTADHNGPKHLEMKLTRSKFNALTANLVERCKKPIEQAIKDSQLELNEIDQVVLVGGSTRIPAIRDLVKEMTGGKEPNQSVNPDEVVAIGAAIQAGVIAGDVKDVVLLDVTPLSLGLETMGGVFTKLVERNTTIPTHKSQIFSTAEDNQPAVDIKIFQGERPIAYDNKLLGNFRLEGIQSAPRGMPQIEVSFDIDSNGILNVTAKDKSTGKEQKITISGSSNLDKNDIDRMIKEAEAHSSEDKKRKEDADRRNEADALCYAVEQKIAEANGNLSDGTRSRAQSLITDIRQKLESNGSPEELSGLLNDLRGVMVVMEQEATQAKAADFATAGAQPGAQPSGSSPDSNDDDDIIDAEVA